MSLQPMLDLAMAASTLVSSAALAAAWTPERVRGTIPSATAVPAVNSTMTNRNVAAWQAQDRVRHLVVTDKGGQPDVLVPPTAPIVTRLPGTKALVAKGADVFIKATGTGSGLMANTVSVGVDRVRPPI